MCSFQIPVRRTSSVVFRSPLDGRHLQDLCIFNLRHVYRRVLLLEISYYRPDLSPCREIFLS